MQQETFEEDIVEKICDMNKHSIDEIKKRDFSACARCCMKLNISMSMVLELCSNQLLTNFIECFSIVVN